MSEHAHIRPDGTVTFLPHRLNRQPVVVRGLTADELWICCGLSGAGGLLLGLPLAWLLSTIALIPTFIVLGIVAGIFIGGGMLRRQKRGQLQYSITTRWPLLSGWIGGDSLIVRAGFWTTRRQTP